MDKRSSTALAGAALTVMALTAACAPGTGYGKSDSAEPAGNGYTIGTSTGPGSGYGSGDDANAPSAKTLSVHQAAGIGNVVTDSRGFTLYRFDEDTANPPASNCNDACATAWPPVPADDVTAADGVKAADLGSVTRADGTTQLTLGGWPVYRYAKDTKAGDTKGQGVGGTWNAIAADGKKAIDEKAPAPAASGAPVSVVNDPDLGKILVDGKWRTLYRFNKDSAWPMKFGCVGACLDTWKPAKPVDKTKVKGIDPIHIGTVTRPDGTKQLAIKCWPVYWFTGDTKPGDINGQGKLGLWFAVSDQGAKVTKTVPSSSSGGSSNGYGSSDSSSSSGSSGSYSGSGSY
jgi:predicted lipoprotein with Yx(FWY)xxD motif